MYYAIFVVLTLIHINKKIL